MFSVNLGGKSGRFHRDPRDMLARMGAGAKGKSRDGTREQPARATASPWPLAVPAVAVMGGGAILVGLGMAVDWPRPVDFPPRGYGWLGALMLSGALSAIALFLALASLRQTWRTTPESDRRRVFGWPAAAAVALLVALAVWGPGMREFGPGPRDLVTLDRCGFVTNIESVVEWLMLVQL